MARVEKGGNGGWETSMPASMATAEGKPLRGLSLFRVV